MAPLKFNVACAVALVLLISVQVRSNNINIDESCPRTGQGCLQCLSRNSEDIERCQQLLFYITYTTENNTAQIDSYCSGRCPIILTTANYYCGFSSDIPALFAECPSYSVAPSGSTSNDVNYNNNALSCLSTTTDCLECIGDRTPEAVRCLQAYLLARYYNSSGASYSSDYCSSNCPLVLNSFTWYCGSSSISTDAYEFCQRKDTAFCGDLVKSTAAEISTTAALCFSNCTSGACLAGINQFGCCLRQTLNNTCPNIPNCTLETSGRTQNIVIDGNCPFSTHGCSQCLSRNSDELERCEQLYTFITETTSNDAEKQEFCSGECPIFLTTSDFFCSSFRSTSDVLKFCPSYNVTPSTSVEITANFSGQNCLDSGTQICLECITSRSPEPTRCLQLYLLASATSSEMYLEEFCTGNCPLTLATTTWYCSLPAQFVFNFCNRTESGQSGQYCRALTTRNTTGFDIATASCRSNCSSAECADAQSEYGCCLTSDGVVNAQCSIPTCSLVTAGAPTLLASASLIATVFSVLIYFLLI